MQLAAPKIRCTVATPDPAFIKTDSPAQIYLTKQLRLNMDGV